MYENMVFISCVAGVFMLVDFKKPVMRNCPTCPWSGLARDLIRDLSLVNGHAYNNVFITTSKPLKNHKCGRTGDSFDNDVNCSGGDNGGSGDGNFGCDHSVGYHDGDGGDL